MASAIEIADFLERLRAAMPPPRDIDAHGYFTALSPISLSTLEALREKLLRAEFDGINYAFYPNPALMAHLARRVEAETNSAARFAERIAHHREEAARLRAEEEAVRAQRDPGWEERCKALMASFDASRAEAEAAEEAARRAEVRARYGMTDEVLASIPDAEEVE